MKKKTPPQHTPSIPYNELISPFHAAIFFPKKKTKGKFADTQKSALQQKEMQAKTFLELL